MTHQYIVSGITCNNCKSTVEASLLNIPEVNNVSIQLKSGEVTISMTSHIDIETLQDELADKYQVEKKSSLTHLNSIEKQSKNELRQLFPLLLIFAYISITALLLNVNPWDTNSFMLDFMGLFFIVFSFFKLLDLKGFPKSFRMYDPLAKAIPAYGWTYPFIEVALGILFLMRIQVNLALFITLFILGITTAGVTSALLNKDTIQCACLGTVLKLPMTKATFIENSIMIVMAIWMLLKNYAI